MIIKVNVKPNARKEEIQRLEDGGYEIHVKEHPEDGKANQKVINLLAREFGVSYKNVKIKNPKRRKKIIEIIEEKR